MIYIVDVVIVDNIRGKIFTQKTITSIIVVKNKRVIVDIFGGSLSTFVMAPSGQPYC